VRVTTAATLQTLTGEAFVNCRKGKLIPSYELELKLEWSGAVGDASASGLVHLPYLADENAGETESLEVRISATADGETERACKALCQKLLVPRIRAAVASWEAEMANGGPGGSNAAPAAPAASAASAAAPKALSAPAPAKPPPPPEPVDGKATISLTERFYCRPVDVFDAFTQPARVRAFTQSDCEVSPAPGAAFRLFSGNIEGQNQEMEPGKLIVQQWRCAAQRSLSALPSALSHPHRQLQKLGAPRLLHAPHRAQRAGARHHRAAAGADRGADRGLVRQRARPGNHNRRLEGKLLRPHPPRVRLWLLKSSAYVCVAISRLVHPRQAAS